MRIKIFTTGGSIDKCYSTQQSDFVVGEPQVGRALQDANVGFTVEIEPLLRKDSLEITDDDRRVIVEEVKLEPCRHVVITHGTDSMALTARALGGVPDKIIVLTGAMQPAEFKRTDAIFNIGCAVMAVQILPVGVHLVMNGRVFDPDGVTKNMELNRFEEI
ncbi:MAG: asparaginase [bacterium]|nr:asparaginase [bacterium]